MQSGRYASSCRQVTGAHVVNAMKTRDPLQCIATRLRTLTVPNGPTSLCCIHRDYQVVAAVVLKVLVMLLLLLMMMMMMMIMMTVFLSCSSSAYNPGCD